MMLRRPRMQASTKASTLGVGCLLLGAALHFQDLGVTTRAVLVIGFFFLTAPVGAHMIARAAYAVGVPLWEGTLVDELRDDQTSALGNTHGNLQQDPHIAKANETP